VHSSFHRHLPHYWQSHRLSLTSLLLTCGARAPTEHTSAELFALAS
jgi:hypothetical protein